MKDIKQLSPSDTIDFLAHFLGVEVHSLRESIHEFTIPRPLGTNANWSMPEIEAQFLYACVKATKPKTVLELGTHLGYSTQFISAALETNGSGRVVTLDYDQHKHDLPLLTASHRVMPLEIDGLAFSKHLCFPIDMIFEDGNHTEENTYQFLTNCLPHLKTGGLIVVHDVAFEGLGDKVSSGMARALGHDIERIIIGDSPCGLGFWIKK